MVGEGEATFAELVDALRDGSPLSAIAGLQYKENGRVRTTPPRGFVELDAEPPMPYHLSTSIATGGGCSASIT